MLSKFSILVSATLVVASIASASEQVPGEILVRYKDGVSRTRLEMNVMYANAGVKKVRRFSAVPGLEQITLGDNVKAEDAIATFLRSDAIEYAQPNYILRTLPVVNPEAQPTAYNEPTNPSDHACWFPGVDFPPGCIADGPYEPGHDPRPALKDAPVDITPVVADPDLDQAYGLAKIHAIDAWKISRGSKSIIVADIDTGIDYNHEDLAFNVWRNPHPGAKGDVVGYDFVHNDGLPYDDNEHGTHTAGTIGAVGGNGIGISGVSQRVSIMAIKFLSGTGTGTTADAIRAIDYAVEHGAKILSNSWGGRGDSNNAALKESIQRAQAKGILFVAAAGNDGLSNDGAGSSASFPAAFDLDNVIAVAATDANDKRASFSNYGKTSVHLAAPGVNVYSTIPGDKYKKESGTSMACPHVTGAAALVWAKHPKWTYLQVKKALLDSVDPVASLADKTITGGRLNVLNALRSTE